VSFLVTKSQIPFEKRVIESGVNWPFPEYRRKTPEELVNDGLKKMKPPPHKVKPLRPPSFLPSLISSPQGGYLSRNEFSELILGAAICSWGECYRRK
jgi:hypothetical protein